MANPAIPSRPKASSQARPSRLFKPLKGVKVLSLALNLPGPAALMRCRQMGASCTKLEPPSGDPMSQYNASAYAELHVGVKNIGADLKSETGQAALHRQLAKTDVLITSFRPSALQKLGLQWRALHKLYPALSQIAIVGSPGERAEEAGHDLTYIAAAGLVPGLELPATLYADMGGSLMASEAVLQAVLAQRSHAKGVFIEVALSDAAGYLALPHHWGLTSRRGTVGGAHAGYAMYACKDGRLALAALEPHFAQRICKLAGVPFADSRTMLAATTRPALEQFFGSRTRAEIEKLARENDLPLRTLKNDQG